MDTAEEITITCDQLKRWDVCETPYKNLMKFLCGDKTKPIPMTVLFDPDFFYSLDNIMCLLSEMDQFRLLQEFGADCAARVLHVYEAEHPGDLRPRKAIVAARNRNIAKKDLMENIKDARSAYYEAGVAPAAYAAAAAAAAATVPFSDINGIANASRTSRAARAARAAIHAMYADNRAPAILANVADTARDAEEKWQRDQLFKYITGTANVVP